MMLGWGTYSGQFTYSITEVFYYITVVLIFVFYLLLVFTFYIFTSTIVKGDRTYRRVRYNDPAVDRVPIYGRILVSKLQSYLTPTPVKDVKVKAWTHEIQ
jgi:hypothetical protein